MSTNNHIDKICVAVTLIALIITTLFMCGEKIGITVVHKDEAQNIDRNFTENDLNSEWDASNAAKIVLSDNTAQISGKGAYFANNKLYIAFAGEYVISGTLNGSIEIDADNDDKIWLLLDNVDVTCDDEAPLYIKQADKVFLTLKDNSVNKFTYGNTDQSATVDGAIFSRDDLTINGKGILKVKSDCLHGIVCNDSLVFTGGDIEISAKKDAVHAHDAIKICNTDFTVSAGDDAFHAGNEEQNSVFCFESGNINITECYEGIEANDVTVAGGDIKICSNDDGINACGDDGNSLITISGGNVTVLNKDGKDADGIDSNGSINITGGRLFISVVGTGTNNAVDYGSENGGKFNISGGVLIACGSGQMAEYPSSDSKQGFIAQNVSGGAGDILSLTDTNGENILSEEIPYEFSFVVLSTEKIAVGDTLILKTENTEIEIKVDNSSENSNFGTDKTGEFKPGGNKNNNEVSPANPDLRDNNEGAFESDFEITPTPNENMMPPEKSFQGGAPEGNMPSENFRGGIEHDGNFSENGTPNGDAPSQPKPDTNGIKGEYNFNDNEFSKDMLSSEDGSSVEKTKTETQSTVDRETIAYVLISAAILIVGLTVALKKKY